jgi:hypothetical protein
MTNKILPSWGETLDIQRVIPIAMKKNPHRWMFFIVQAYHGKSIYEPISFEPKVQHQSRVFMISRYFRCGLTRGHGVIFAKTLVRGVLP